MKITSGKYKYRNIELPKGIRPTTGKVREAVLSMVGPWTDGAAVLDLFAGSGSLGLEALSRGADHCFFCESSRANSKVLLSNISECGAGEESTVFNNDYQAAISKLGGLGITLDVVFMDPPYEELAYYEKGMLLLQENELLDEGSLVVAEHLYDNKLSDTYVNLHKIKEKRYGSIGVDVYIYEKCEEETE